MDIHHLQKKALDVRVAYDSLKRKNDWLPWGPAEFALGLVGDVGDLAKLIMAKGNLRAGTDVERRLRHELADCLWSLFVIADQLGIDIESSFLVTMDELGAMIGKELGG